MSGSCSWNAKQAVGHALELADAGKLSITKLGLQVLQRATSYGRECFRTDAKLAESITQTNGRKPHPGSVARVRRDLTRQGVFTAKRIFTGQKISEYASRRGFRHSAHGVVRLRLNGKMGFRLLRDEPKPKASPRHAATAALTPSLPRVRRGDYDTFARMAAPAIAAQDARELVLVQQQDYAMYESIARARGQPP